jgi:hypothetical protein
MLQKMMLFQAKNEKVGNYHGFPAVIVAGLLKKSIFFNSPELSISCQPCFFIVRRQRAQMLTVLVEPFSSTLTLRILGFHALFVLRCE